MVTKQRKKRRGTKKISQKSLFIGLALFFGGITVLGIGFFLFSSAVIPSPPIYEETHSFRNDLHDGIRRIDNAIYDSLYQGAVAEKDIFFLAIRPKHSKGYSWDLTEILIKLPNRRSLVQTEKILIDKLSSVKPKVSFETEKIMENEIVYHIFALGFYTHKLILIYEGYYDLSRKGLSKIAIIIDDLGYDYGLAKSFMQLDLPICLSILPLAPHTERIVSEANKRGREIMLHLPMEPKNYPSLNPGPGALLTSMDEREIRRILKNRLERISGVKGVNNHMGSSFTGRPDKMGVVLSELRMRHLFFIDSRTTSETVAFSLAKEMGVPAAKRSVFLDNDLSPKAIKIQMERLLGIARHSGSSIGIGHPNKGTLKVLKQYLPKLKNEVKVVPVSELVS